MSSSDYAIRIKGIGKQYRLGIEQSGGMYKYKSLRDSLGGMVRSPLKTARSLLPEPLNDSNSFWALKDVSFDVKRGEVVGIIGRNGAGKSTLLKILSRITRPTTGEIELHGRVGSLLEVGTGFHPELSGRENIYLNGAVLGMTRAEVKSKFDEIVSFSEIEKFLDTPVKQYSSGMYMRLAFAVAAHLEPEILVVDEVLAVGDGEFQKKCLGKVEHVAHSGRTVLIVSHNIGQMLEVANRGLHLCQGRIQGVGAMADVAEAYQRSSNTASPSQRVFMNEKICVRLLEVRTTQGRDCEMDFLFTEGITIKLGLSATSPIGGRVDVQISLRGSLGEPLGCVNTPEEGLSSFDLHRAAELCLSIPSHRLLPGRYTLGIVVWQDSIKLIEAERVHSFNVIPSPLVPGAKQYTSTFGSFRFGDLKRN